MAPYVPFFADQSAGWGRNVAVNIILRISQKDATRLGADLIKAINPGAEIDIETTGKMTGSEIADVLREFLAMNRMRYLRNP